ncbi:MAG: dTDP-4-dehydrorhamnose 3,5-epimerase [Rhizobiaceae bacterium]
MPISVRPLALPEIVEIIPVIHCDERGFFSETYNQVDMAANGIAIDWLQDNQSLSASKGVLRGLHFQIPPVAQDKLVRVVKGSILDVAVDIRKGSPGFGKWVCLEVSAKKWNQILVPKGFAHGFVTLEPETEVLYKVSAPYSREHDRCIRFDDPAIGIDWGLGGQEPILSAKDANAPLLSDIDTGFVHEN